MVSISVLATSKLQPPPLEQMPQPTKKRRGRPLKDIEGERSTEGVSYQPSPFVRQSLIQGLGKESTRQTKPEKFSQPKRRDHCRTAGESLDARRRCRGNEYDVHRSQ